MQLLGKDYFSDEGDTFDFTGEQSLLLLPEGTAETEIETVGTKVKKSSIFPVIFNFMKQYKKQAVVGASVLLIGLAVYVNWFLYRDLPITSDDGESIQDVNAEAQEEDNYFATSVINRERARDEAMEVLQSVVDGSESESPERVQAMEDIATIASNMEKESTIESLVCGKGFSDCVAVLQGETASVVVKANDLLENEIVQIQEIVYETAGILPVNLKIIEH